MSDPRSTGTPASTIPELGALARRLAEAGGRAWLVGPALLRWIEGNPEPPLTLWTTASHADIARVFPRAVPMPGSAHAGGTSAWRVATGPRPTFLRPLDTPTTVDATRTLDTAATGDGTRPLDPTTTADATRTLDAQLARMPFGVLAIAACLETGEWRDPSGGRADLAARRLRLLDSPAAAAGRDPLLVLRAAWLCARHGLDMDDTTAASLEDACRHLDRVPPAHLASMLLATLAAPNADAGARLLDRTGVGPAWLGTAANHATPTLGALPDDPALRLLAWSRGAKPGAILRRIRLDRGTRTRAIALAEHHPIDVHQPNPRPRALRRLIERIGRGGVDGLIALRRAELAEGVGRDVAANDARGDAIARIDAIARGLELFDHAATAKPVLAVRGGELIAALDLPAGPAIGRLLTALERAVIERRVENETHALIALARTLVAGDALDV